MPSKNQLPSGPSLRMFAARKDEAVPSPERAVRCSPSDGSSRKPRPRFEVVARTAAGARSAACDRAKRSSRPKRLRELFLTIKTIADFAARARIELAAALLAAASWVVAQILAGCAEYCQAMYPAFEPDQPADWHDPAG